MNTLPTELQLLIFAAAAGLDGIGATPSLRVPLPTLFAMRSVCRHWHALCTLLSHAIDLRMHTRLPSPDELQMIGRAFPLATALNINERQCGYLTDKWINGLHAPFPNLLSLCFYNSFAQFSDECLARALSNYTNLSEFFYTGRTGAPGCGSAVFAALQACTKLQHLTLYWCNNFDQRDLIAVLKKTPELLTVNVCGCRQLTDAFLHAVVEHCPKIQRVVATFIPLFSAKSIRALLSHCRIFYYDRPTFVYY